MALRASTRSLVAALFIASSTTIGCGGDDESSTSSAQAEVEVALAAFAADLAASPIEPDELYPRIQAYLQAHPDFFGSTVTLLGEDGRATYSPYAYRKDGGYARRDLHYPEYHIDDQEWLVLPRDGKRAVWSPPYFDAGGGEIWMVTRSVPLLDDEGRVYAVVTTDLPIPPPED
jgi:sigma-B regulation protein RsbU (phosphoserine phosphatase)